MKTKTISGLVALALVAGSLTGCNAFRVYEPPSQKGWVQNYYEMEKAHQQTQQQDYKGK